VHLIALDEGWLYTINIFYWYYYGILVVSSEFRGIHIVGPSGTLSSSQWNHLLWTTIAKLYSPYSPICQFTYMRVERWSNHMGWNWGAIGNT
jgi:hypothetical protein